MDYIKLFGDRDVITVGNFQCKQYRIKEEVTFSTNKFSIIFVLAGKMTVNSLCHSCVLEAGNLIAINQSKITNCICEDNTIILEYCPSSRLTFFLTHCSSAFDSPYSGVVPILSSLESWINEQLMKDSSLDYSDEDLCNQRKEFAKIMISYPRSQIQELYVVFFACASGDCENCEKSTLINKS